MHQNLDQSLAVVADVVVNVAADLVVVVAEVEMKVHLDLVLWQASVAALPAH